jgi:O-acetylhomoserine/O-acetylserine sulfhydrylase-like pyridoxal-dependent enzyme
MGFTTKQVHAGVTPDPVSGAILTPIYQATTFVQESVDQYLAKGFSYSRSGNPTVRALEQKLAVLEGGVDCSCYATGWHRRWIGPAGRPRLAWCSSSSWQ